MKTFKYFAFLLGLIFVAQFHAGEAAAQATRTWVSGVGDDANPCSRTAPCKTFAGAISKTAAGGEINTLDPGGFGSVTITKSITISAEAGTGGIVVAGTNAIIINAAATDIVTLSGLDIEGLSKAPTSAGLSGIKVITAERVFVNNCSIRNFSVAGIEIAPTTNATRVEIDNVRLTNTQSGVFINGATKSGLANISNSVLSGHKVAAINVDGIGAKAVVNRNVISGNALAFQTANSAKIVTLSNNMVGNNTADGVTTDILAPK